MATITLSALPGHHEQTAGQPYRVSVIEITAEILGRATAEAKTLDQVRRAVARFGEAVAASHPGRSFTVSVGVAKGCRKLNGFDAPNRSDGLGQERWMQTVTKPGRVAPGTPAAATA